MEYKDLIGIGRLGGRDNDGYFHVMVKPDFKSVLSGLAECFLIFNSDRVFFVSIQDIKTCDKKTWIKFNEDGIETERDLHKEVIIAIDRFDEEDEDDPELELLDSLIDATVYFMDKELGRLDDYFYNGAQYVLVIKAADDTEILVPFVDHFVVPAEQNATKIVLRNAKQLLEI